MPIRFKCPHPECGATLSIASRKAGSTVGCPRCSRHIKVPTPRPITGVLIDETPDEPEPSVPPPVERDWRNEPPPSRPSRSPVAGRFSGAVTPNQPDDSSSVDEAPDDEFDDGFDLADGRGSGRGYRRHRTMLVDLVALIYLIDAALCFLCGGLILFGAGFAVFGEHRLEHDERAFLGGLAGFLAFVTIVLGLPSLLTAYGVWKRHHWGRVLGLVMGGVNGFLALGSLLLLDPCGMFIDGFCAALSLTVLLMPRYAEEFS